MDPQRFVLCTGNDGHAASLEVRKVYAVLPAPAAESRGLLRVIDETGEAYLYPSTLFVPVEVPPAAAGLFLER